MATDLRRFTISITPTMEVDLDKAKKERYYKDTQNEMIRPCLKNKSCTRNQVMRSYEHETI